MLRICSICGKKITYEGYCYDGGMRYYCSKECLHTEWTDEEWRKECEPEDSQSFYTDEWEEDYEGEWNEELETQ